MLGRGFRHIWTVIAACLLVLSLVLFLLPHAGAVSACFVLLSVLFFGLIPLPNLIVRWDLLHCAVDAPTLPPSLQRPPPFLSC